MSRFQRLRVTTISPSWWSRYPKSLGKSSQCMQRTEKTTFVESLEADDLIDSGRVSFVSSTTQKIVGTRNKCSDALFPFIDLLHKNNINSVLTNIILMHSNQYDNELRDAHTHEEAGSGFQWPIMLQSQTSWSSLYISSQTFSSSWIRFIPLLSLTRFYIVQQLLLLYLGQERSHNDSYRFNRTKVTFAQTLDLS